MTTSADERRNLSLGPSHVPLVVDLDGTLTPTDTLVESAISALKAHPFDLLAWPAWLLRGKAFFKSKIASRGGFSAEHLPLRGDFHSFLNDQSIKGRRLILATAADERIADAVARRTGLFGAVLASNAHANLKGRHKLAAIQALVGTEFCYAGDSNADLVIWRSAHSAILVNVSPRLKARLPEDVRIEKEFHPTRPGIAGWTKALRIHQWLKNSLLFVPLLTSFLFLDLTKLASVVVAFFAFSMAASATYVVNDLLDLDSDRTHPRKRFRPFASASIPITQGVAGAAALLLGAFALAFTVSGSFAATLLSYVVLTSAYSWVLKQYVLIDVLTLSMLYTLRILAGAVAIGVPTSPWLLAFSVFVFSSLALVKRCAELVSLQEDGQTATRGRDYRVSDQQVLTPLGVATAAAAVVVFGLYLSSAEVQAQYASPPLLWLVALGLIYWLGRLWIKTQRGEMHDDPLVFALRDHGSRVTIAAMIFIVLLAQNVRGVHW